MNLRDVIISVIIFGIIIAGSGVFIGQLGSEYNVTTDTAFVNTYDKIDEMHEKTESMQETVSGEGGILSTIGGLFVKGTWYVVQMIVSTIKIVDAMIKDLFVTLGFPSWFGYGIMGIIIVTIIGMALGLIMRREV